MKEAARLEDLNTWVMEKTKTTKKGESIYAAGWPPGEKAARREIST
jgi:hypothetical protein